MRADGRRGACVMFLWWSRVRPQVARVLDAGAVAALKAMLVSGAEDPNGVHNAVAALGLICAVPEGRDAAFAEEVPVALETASKTASPGVRTDIAFAVSKMCVRGARVCADGWCACACDVRCAVRAARADARMRHTCVRGACSHPPHVREYFPYF